MMMIEKSIKKVPIARIVVDTPYNSGEVEALCLSDAIFDLVIGNIPDARPPNVPNLLRQTAVCDVNNHTRKAKETSEMLITRKSQPKRLLRKTWKTKSIIICVTYQEPNSLSCKEMMLL